MKRIGSDGFKEFLMPSRLRVLGGIPHFILKQANMETDSYKSDLYRLEGGDLHQLTDLGDVQNYFPLGQRIFLAAEIEGRDKEDRKAGRAFSHIYELKEHGLQSFLRIEGYHIIDILFLSEDRFFFTALYDPAYENAMAKHDSFEEGKSEIDRERDYEVITELPLWQNGRGYTGGKRTRLYLFDGGEICPVTDEKTNAALPVISPDKKRAAFIGERYEDKSVFNNQIFLYEMETKDLSDHTFIKDSASRQLAFLDEDTLLCILRDGKDFGVKENESVYKYAISEKKGELIQGSGEYVFGNSVNCDVKLGLPAEGGIPVKDGEYYFLSTYLYGGPICAGNLETGEIRRVTRHPISVGEFVLSEGGIYYLAMEAQQGTELYFMDAEGEVQSLTSLGRHIEQTYEILKPMTLSFENTEGDIVYGFVLPPAGLEEGKKYPAVLNVHGGPKTVFGSCYHHEMQFLAAQGYAVLYCNPTGSDGQGNEFADVRGKYGGIDYNDIMLFLNRCLDAYDFIDPERLGVMGGSYGGFMVNWMIGHSDRFGAAVSMRSISNWISFCTTSEIGEYFGEDQMGTDVWDSQEELWYHSPLRYAHRVEETPTLFIHGDEDYVCPLSEGIQMFYALKRLGKAETQMRIFHGENHELSRSGKPSHRVRRLEDIALWMDKYLKKGEQ